MQREAKIPHLASYLVFVMYNRKTIKKCGDAVKSRKNIMLQARKEEGKLIQLAAPGINPYTMVVLFKKIRPNMPADAAAITCPEPSAEIFKMVGEEKKDRKN